MPLGNTLPSTELELIRNWINQMPPPAPPEPTPTSTPPSGGHVILPSQDYKPLGDRFFVKSTLDLIYGPGSSSITSALVASGISTFGGACDPMKEAPAAGEGVDSCSNVDAPSFVSPIVPVASTRRAGQTIKVCNILNMSDVTLQYAISFITGKSDLNYLKVDRIPTPDELKAAYRVFFPTRGAPSTDILTDLTSLATALRSSTCTTGHPRCELDSWRYVLLTLCYEPSWQVL
jgi:hypothetical protein